MGALYIGPLTIKYELLFTVLSIMIAYFVVKSTTKKYQDIQKPLLDTLFNAFMIGFLIYKFSIALFRPSIIIDNPIGLLYFTGGLKGLFLGILLAIIYFIVKSMRSHWPSKVISEVIVYTIVTFMLSFWFLRTLFYLFQ